MTQGGQLDVILFNRLGYTTAQECTELLTATYSAGQLLPRHRYIAEEVAMRAHTERDASGNPTPGRDAAKRGREQSRGDASLDPWQPHPGPDSSGPTQLVTGALPRTRPSDVD